MHQFDLKNKTAIITGGAQGFGFEIAKKFLQSGSKVFIWDIDEKELSKAANEINNPNLNYNVVEFFYLFYFFPVTIVHCLYSICRICNFLFFIL